jgi:hypothetical protein
MHGWSELEDCLITFVDLWFIESIDLAERDDFLGGIKIIQIEFSEIKNWETH